MVESIDVVIDEGLAQQLNESHSDDDYVSIEYGKPNNKEIEKQPDQSEGT